jgi:hypothetical protein
MLVEQQLTSEMPPIRRLAKEGGVAEVCAAEVVLRAKPTIDDGVRTPGPRLLLRFRAAEWPDRMSHRGPGGG